MTEPKYRTCRYCGKKIQIKKFGRHRCNGRKKAYEYYHEWERAQPPGSPHVTFQEWETIQLAAELRATSGQPADTDSDVATTASDKTDANQGPDSSSVDATADPHLADHRAARREDPVPDRLPAADVDVDGPIAPPVKRDLTKAVQALSTLTASPDPIDQHLTARERGWLPIIAGIHEGIMWLADADRRKTRFKLTKPDKKTLASGWVTTVGDSPIQQYLRRDGASASDPDVLTAHLEVYGEWIPAQSEGFITKIKGMWAKAQEARRRKRENEKTDE